MKKAAAILLLLACVEACEKRLDPGMLTPVPDAEAVGVFHEVGKGETLTSICAAYKADLQEVAEMNGIEDAGKIQAGQRIFIPDVDKSLRPPAKTVESPHDDATIRKWKGQFIWPIDKGVITSKFGIRGRRRHDGIDIAAPVDTPIKSAAKGKVLYAGDQQRGYGNLIIIRHAGDMITVYAHNSENLVKEGEQVEQGQRIGKVGSTGRSTGPHLHFEIRKRTKPRNPLFFLPKPP
jgi:murein DD-endopeptidase MepM/ murein hydrolase activator NlpD